MVGLLARRFLTRSGAAIPWLSSHNGDVLLRRSFCSGVLPDTIDRSSESFARNSRLMEGIVSQLHSNIRQVMEAGGAAAVMRNQSRNKLLPRERIQRLIDPGSSFLELSQEEQINH